MIKTLQNMTAALVCCCLMLMSSAVMAQCPCPIDGASLWQGATASPYSGVPVVGTTCAYAGEYSNFIVMAGQTYDVVATTTTSAIGNPAVTVFSSVDSTALDCGAPVSTFTATYDGIYHALVTEVVTDSTGTDFCVTESSCHTLTITCLTCPAPPMGCTDVNAHNYDPNAGADDGSCETCFDGIMNGDETGVDCGGSNINCAVCPALINSCDTTSVDSGGAAAAYSNSEFITTTYCPEVGAGGNIQATFTAFATEACCDFLSVYDGMDTNAPLLGTFSGTAIPSAMIASTDGCLTFVFTSDGSVTAAGWEADIACVSCSAPMLDAMAYCNAGDGSGYYVDLMFTPGSGSSYTLSDGAVTAPLNAATTLTVGPYANASTVVFTVTDDNDACSATASATFNCAPGQTCDDPIMIDALPYVETGATTEGFGDDYGTDLGGNICGDSYMNGDDIVYNFVATDTCINITLTNTSSWVGILLLDGCPGDSLTTCVGTANSGSGTDPVLEGASVMVGMDYYVIVSTWPSPQFTAFDIAIEACPMPCQPITVTATATDVTCAGNDGAVNITSATGGSGVYTDIVWSNGEIGVTSISGLPMGDYTVIVTDDMGCTGETTVTVGDGCVATCGAINSADLVSLVDASGATLSWPAVPNAQAYQMAGRKQGGTTKVFPETQNTSRTFPAAALQPATTYQWSIRVKCDAVWTDYALPPVSFTTPAGKSNANSYDIFAEGNNLSVKMYPNPANTQVVLQLTEAVNFDNVATQKTVKITDMLGRVINTFNTTNAQMTLNVNDFANGSYFVVVSNGQETVVEKLLIVR